MSSSSSCWALWQGLISEFSERHTTSLVFVHFVDNLLHLLLAYEVSSRFDHSLELVGAQATCIIEIE